MSGSTGKSKVANKQSSQPARGLPSSTGLTAHHQAHDEVAGMEHDQRKVKPEDAGASTRLAEPPGQQQPLLFSREDWTLYTSLAHLPQKAGVRASDLPRLIAKELCDNALDAADVAGNPGAVQVSVNLAGDLIVADRGTGIADATAEKIASLFCVARPMVSSKLLRRPTCGAVGNGLRVCLGFLTTTGDSLVVETSNIRVTLAPEIDGSSRVVDRTTIETIQGLTLTAVAGDQPFTDDHLAWALDAIELAQQSSKPAFSGRPSPHWLDLDHFRVLLASAVGPVSVRQFLAQLDGCQGSRAQTRIAAKFLRRTAASLSAAEAAELLAAAQAAVKPPKARALCQLGRDAVPCDGYALAEGTFTEGLHEPRASICFLVETCANAYRPDEQSNSLTTAVYMNRTRALIPLGGSVWDGWLNLTIGSTRIQVSVPEGPHYSLDIAITSPMFRLTSDGKQPDCAPFAEALREAISKATKAAGREISALMTTEEKQDSARYRHQQHDTEQQQRLADREAREQRKAEIEQLKAERKAMPTIQDVVLELLPGAVAIESESGLPFNTRRLVYRIRDRVLRRTGKELTQGYFDDLLTKIEAEQGDLSPLLYREARGSFLIPHEYNRAMPLGTLTVREFRRPAWTFNKVLLIEKDDLRYMLEKAGWAERHDCLIMSSKGFSTRAARDLIDFIAGTDEPVQVFCVHDADAAGTLIQHTLQHETKARAARRIEVIDLGLQPWEGVALDLAVERVPIDYRKDGQPRKRPVGQYVCERTDLIDSETWEQWLQHARVELNAFTSAELIKWLDEKMVQHAKGKLIPPDDVLQDRFASGVRDRVCQHVEQTIRMQLDTETARIKAEIEKISSPIEAEIQRVTAPLRARITRLSKPFRTQIEQLTEPLKQQIMEAEVTAAAVDREAETKALIQKICPAPEMLQAAVAESFTNRPQLRWSDVLQEITAAVRVGQINLDGDGPEDDEALACWFDRLGLVAPSPTRRVAYLFDKMRHLQPRLLLQLVNALRVPACLRLDTTP